MSSLIERIEAATGPCRNLDVEIHRSRGKYIAIPKYTSSIAAAMTLCCSDVFIHLQDAIDAVQEEMVDASIGEKAEALPRFICAAALRARGVE